MSNIGFLTIAQNNRNTDYLKLAYLQAMNIKLLHPEYQYAVIVDKNTLNQLTSRMQKVFDHVINLPIDYAENDELKYANEVNVFRLTPFKETFKVESDLLFTRPVNNWISALRLKSIVLSYGCKNYKNMLSNNLNYRQIFVNNNLPNVYNGLMYFRKTVEAEKFFLLAEKILINWTIIKDQLIGCTEDKPSTDVLYALTAKIFKLENCTMPSLDFFNFIHMPIDTMDWGKDKEGWTNKMSHEKDNFMIRIGNLNQYYPVHYQDKKFCDDNIIEWYEEKYEQLGRINKSL